MQTVFLDQRSDFHSEFWPQVQTLEHLKEISLPENAF